MVIFQPKIDDTRMINKKRTGEKSQWNLPQIFFTSGNQWGDSMELSKA